MKQFNPKISKQLLDKLVLYMNERPYKEVAGLLSELYAEVQVQLPKGRPVMLAPVGARKAKPDRSTANGHYAKGP